MADPLDPANAASKRLKLKITQADTRAPQVELTFDGRSLLTDGIKIWSLTVELDSRTMIPILHLSLVDVDIEVDAPGLLSVDPTPDPRLP